MRLRDLVELVRAPAALSVPGDALVGATAAGVVGMRTVPIAAASVCLYWAGMAANDWADRKLDSVERPERPIPSGRVSPVEALAVAGGLTAAGLCLAAQGRRTLTIAGVLATAVWAYDLRWKNTAAGPAGMALCRGLDVLMGAAEGTMRRAVPAALTVAAHTYAVTELSRREVSGAERPLPAATLAATGTISTIAAFGLGKPRRAAPRIVAVALAARYAAQFGRAQLAVLSEPKADNVRASVGAGIMALPVLQGTLTSRLGRPGLGLALAAAAALGRRLAKAVSTT